MAKTMGDILAEQRERDELEAGAEATALAAIGFLPEPLKTQMKNIVTGAQVSPKAGVMLVIGALAGMAAAGRAPAEDIVAAANKAAEKALAKVARSYAWAEKGATK